jgi:RND family efflux transporter MFP subunit
VNATTGIATSGPFRETITAIGSVVSRPGSVALLSAPSATRVANVLAVAGQAVKKGTPLVEFERAPFDARAASAEAALQAAELAHSRAERLVAQGIAARKDEEQATAELARAKAEAVAARREAQLSRLESPIDGIVTKMNAVLGASVDASQPLVEVADPRAIDIVLQVAPEEASRIHTGARATISSGQGPGATAIGTSDVREVGGSVDADSRAVSVRVRGSDALRSLRIGESVTAEITVAEYAKAVTVPIKALVPDGEGYKVFVVDPDGVCHDTPVKIGGRTTTMVRIADGLKAGQIVVVEGAFGMTDGGKVAGISDPDEDEPDPAADPKSAPAKGDSAKKPEGAKKP